MSEGARSLELAPAPIERVQADLVIVPLFESERPLRGAAGRLDWRLCGRLSQLFAAGRVRGQPGGAVLIPGGGGVRAPRVLGLGIGVRSALDGAPWEQWVTDALARARDLSAQRFVIAPPASEEALGERLATLAGCLAAQAGALELLLAPESCDQAATVEWLRSAARRRRPAGIEIRSPAEARQPHGGSPPSRLSESSPPSAGRFTR